MKTPPIALAGILALWVLSAGASAQPILNRVEKLLRDQLDSAKAPAAAVEPGYLGLNCDDTPEAAGVRVLQVFAGQPAAAAGVRVGDLITAIDEVPIRVMDDMARALAGKPPGTKLAFSVTRQGDPRRLELTLGRRPGAPAAREELPAPGQLAGVPDNRLRLGVRTVPVSEIVRRQNNLPSLAGAQVVSVTVGSPAERAAIPLGAILTAVDGSPIGTPSELAAKIAAAKGPEVELTYVHRGQPQRQKIALAAPAVAGDTPPRELRAKPPLVEFPGPSADTKPEESSPAAEAESPDRVAALERRLKALEARIKTLEAELAKDKPAADAEPK
jgi:S1-C subfamily serine protease